MSTLGIVFPGQGCQYVGMATALQALVPQARRRLLQADDLLGYSLSTLCLEGPGDLLDSTENTQPAIYTASVALWEHLNQTMADAGLDIACMAGHSLGEFSALTAAGTLSFEDGLRLVRRRAQAMAEAGARTKGSMAAVLGLSDEAVQALVSEARATAGDVWVANYNSPGQVVVAGTDDGLAAVQELAVAHRAKRVVPLAVSVACHTPLMGGASDALRAALAEVPLAAPRWPVISNVTAAPQSDPEEIRQGLMRQLVSPVRWVESVEAMGQLGVQTLLEVGPKSVLSGLVRRIPVSLSVDSVVDAASIETWVASRKVAQA